MGAELLHGVEIGHILGQLIVYFGQLLGADGVYLNVEHGVLALELVAVVFIGELNVKILLLANIHAYHLLFKAGYEHAAADGQLLMLCRAAVELNAVHCAAVIKLNFVAVFNGALNVYHAGDLLALALDLGVHHFIRNIILLLCHFYTLILAQSDLGHNGNNSLKLHILALFGVFSITPLGACPLRKPGIAMVLRSLRYALSIAFSKSAAGMLIVSFT